MTKGTFEGRCADCNSALDEYSSCEGRCKACYDAWERENSLEWVCPACDETFDKAISLRSHMAGKMQSDAAHGWRNVEIDHHYLTPAARSTD